LVVAALLVVAAGCRDEVARYRVLSFFFDGVPPPAGMPNAPPKKIVGPWGIRLDPNDPNAREIIAAATRAATQTATEEPVAFLHAPYRDRLCRSCHSGETSFQVPLTTDICRKCHLPYYDLKGDDWVHGPVALGKCAMCHTSHKSEYPGLLTTAMPNLCFSCHEARPLLDRPYHAEANTRSCTACHDPHSAGNRLLLADSESYRRRKLRALPVPQGHAQWTRKECATCHLSEKSNLVVAGVDQQCLPCHEKVQKAPGPGTLHAPVREGKCTACHTPHQSALPHLVRPTAEQMCYPCHKLSEFQKPSHPPVNRADCLLCHAGHRSPEAHLLKATPGAVRATTRVAGTLPALDLKPTTTPGTRP
jgi:predicted CXXCH cytochrome family protein